MFDTLGEVIAGGVVVLIALFMVLRFLKHRRIAREANGTLTVEETSTTTKTTTPATQPATPPCDSYQHEHMLILKALQESLTDLKQTLLGLNEMQIAETGALDVLLGLAEGEEVNGQVTAARNNLTRAQGFKQATETIGGSI